MYFIAMLAAVVMYVVVSLLTSEKDFDLDRVLHRGKWAFDENGNPLPPVPKPPRNWKAILGIDSNFTRGDVWTNALLFAISMLMAGLFVVISIWNLLRAWPVRWWANYWYVVGILFPLVLGVITTVWFTIGGLKDLRQLFRNLASTPRDALDDGIVRDAVRKEPAIDTTATARSVIAHESHESHK
jgi:SSS family solute:Na+ symporter